ncbi:acyl-CoA-binding domain-containing protein 6-like protein [Tanacetum coccineum]
MGVARSEQGGFSCGVRREAVVWAAIPSQGRSGGQSVSFVCSKLIMFGGEDKNRRLMNDVHVLDLETMTWNVVDTIQTPQAPIFDHTAAVHAERYLQIFGGWLFQLRRGKKMKEIEEAVKRNAAMYK